MPLTAPRRLVASRRHTPGVKGGDPPATAAGTWRARRARAAASSAGPTWRRPGLDAKGAGKGWQGQDDDGGGSGPWAGRDRFGPVCGEGRFGPVWGPCKHAATSPPAARTNLRHLQVLGVVGVGVAEDVLAKAEARRKEGRRRVLARRGPLEAAPSAAPGRGRRKKANKVCRATPTCIPKSTGRTWASRRPGAQPCP